MIDLILVAIICLLWAYWKVSRSRPKNFPPGPDWLPLVGNQFELKAKSKELGGQQFVFKHWMEKYDSPVIGLKLGNDLVVVGMTHAIVHDIHTRSVFDGRPDNFFIRLRSMGSKTRLGITGSDGEVWSEQRNFVMKHLRMAGFGRAAMEEQIQVELDGLLELIEQEIDDEKGFWPGELLPTSVLNVLWTFLAGQKIKRNDDRLLRLLELMKLRSRAFDMSGGWISTLPFLRFIAPEMTKYNLILQFNKEIRAFFQEIIDEHKLEYSEDRLNDDLVFAYLHEMKLQEGKSTNFTESQLMMIILDLFLGGSHTTAITLDLALMSMVLNPNVQKRAHAEIDEVLGGAQYPALKDKSKLVYIEAILHEVSRFYNILATSGPRRTLQATTLGGYNIPKNTTILIGVHSVHTDPDYWNNPDEFQPERFLDENNKLFNTERMMTFGQGHRSCPGINLGRAALFTFFVGILQRYRIELPVDGDMPTTKTIPGIMASPKPYKVMFKAR